MANLLLTVNKDKLIDRSLANNMRNSGHMRPKMFHMDSVYTDRLNRRKALKMPA